MLNWQQIPPAPQTNKYSEPCKHYTHCYILFSTPIVTQVRSESPCQFVEVFFHPLLSLEAGGVWNWRMTAWLNETLRWSCEGAGN